MNEKQQKRISKFLSLVLRHKPEEIGLELNEQGWAQVDELISKLAAHGEQISLPDLQLVVKENDKQRFAFSEDGIQIRASQGHSLSVELNLESKIPPATLYHGSPEKNRASILENGLDKRQRQHVHLSADKETAIKVGQRRGKALVFVVDATSMHEEGIKFYQSANGVWLTDSVPAKFLGIAEP